MRGMVIEMNDEQLRTLADLQGFLDGTVAMDFTVVEDELRIPTIVTGCTDDRDRWVSGDAWCSNCTAVGHDDAMQGCP
jgi:hypothetical protein